MRIISQDIMTINHQLRAVLLIVAALYLLPAALTLADEDKSIGTVAGESFKQVQNTSQNAYEATSKSASETASEMEKSLANFSDYFKKQLDQAAKAAQEALDHFSKAFEREYEKFKVASQSPQKR